jgi:hypothetical protein
MRGRFFARKLVASFAAGVVCISWLLTCAPAAIAQTQTAVEYYYADWNFYFVTSLPAEISALDGGAFGGAWKRTGQTFTVWSDASSGALPTCRFFSTSFAPKSSHFYTPYAAECTVLESNPGWQFESIAFYLQLPDANGNCASGTVILYRLYNNGMGGAPNHRFTTDAATFSQMQVAGWTFEGDGRTGAFACVPAATAPPAGTAEGLWRGTTSANQTALGLVLDDGTYYLLYSRTGAATDAGVVQGSSTALNGTLTSSDGLDFPIQAADNPLGHWLPATVGGTYVPRASLQLTIGEGSASRTVSASYDPDYDHPASLAAAAGTYSGRSGSVNGATCAMFTVDANGNLSGSNCGGCTFQGTITPHKSVNVFDWSVTVTGGCPPGGAPVTGVLYYDVTSAQIHAFAPCRSDVAACLTAYGNQPANLYYWIGTKQ